MFIDDRFLGFFLMQHDIVLHEHILSDPFRHYKANFAMGCLRFVIVVFTDHTHLLFLLSFHFIFIVWQLYRDSTF